jgi:hypothetical protein
LLLLLWLVALQAQASHLSDAGLVLDHHHPATVAVAAAAAAATRSSSSQSIPEAATSEAAAAGGGAVSSSGQPDAAQDGAATGAAAEADPAAQQLLQVLRELLPADAMEQLESDDALQHVQLLEAERWVGGALSSNSPVYSIKTSWGLLPNGATKGLLQWGMWAVCAAWPMWMQLLA